MTNPVLVFPHGPFPRDFSTRELFSRPELSFHSNFTPALILGRAGSSSRRGLSHPTLLPQYYTVERSSPVLQLSQSPSPCVYLIGLAELRCYHRAVVKLTPEFPGTGTSKFSPSCSRTTFIYQLDLRRFKATKLDLRRFKATSYFFGDSKPRHISSAIQSHETRSSAIQSHETRSSAIQSHDIFLRRFKATKLDLRRFKATSYFFGDSKPTCLRRLKATQHFTPGDSPTCFELFLPLSRLFSPSTTSVSSAKRLQPLTVRDPLFSSTAPVQVLLASLRRERLPDFSAHDISFKIKRLWTHWTFHW